jgi:hypothetical protein
MTLPGSACVADSANGHLTRKLVTSDLRYQLTIFLRRIEGCKFFCQAGARLAPELREGTHLLPSSSDGHVTTASDVCHRLRVTFGQPFRNPCGWTHIWNSGGRWQKMLCPGFREMRSCLSDIPCSYVWARHQIKEAESSRHADTRGRTALRCQRKGCERPTSSSDGKSRCVL